MPEQSSGESKDGRRALWVLGSLFLLFALWLVNPGPPLAKGIFAFVAAWRLLEIFTTGLGTSLEEERQVRARSLVTIAIYALQVTLIFAVLYHSLSTDDFVSNPGHSHAAHATDYFYVSWTNVTSLGSTYDPTTGLARLLSVLTTTFGIFLLGVLLAFGIDAVKKDEEKKKKRGKKGAAAASSTPPAPTTVPSP
jgi:preprotein translocase subunit SecG